MLSDVFTGGAVALTLALVWAWRRHGERARAYAAALAGDR